MSRIDGDVVLGLVSVLVVVVVVVVVVVMVVVVVTWLYLFNSITLFTNEGVLLCTLSAVPPEALCFTESCA